jgi:inositol 1,4,5-triphosphate receptor type 1
MANLHDDKHAHDLPETAAAPPDTIKVEGSVDLVLKILQNLCEGHNAVLQDYLRQQPDNMRSIDLVTETVHYAKELVLEVDGHNIALVTQTITTLVEFAQGCVDNQHTLFQEQIVDTVNHLLRLPDFGSYSVEEVW